MNAKLVFQCCFCGRSIDETLQPRLEIGAGYPGQAVQTIYAHETCLAAVVHPSVQISVPEATEDESE